MKREKLSSWMGRLDVASAIAGSIVVIGLVVEDGPELLKSFVTKTLPQRAVTGALLVTLGVLAEVTIAFTIARIAKRIEAIDAEHIANIRRDAAAAEERAALAEKAAAEANLETEKLKAQFSWRSLMGPVGKLTAVLSSQPGSVWIEYPHGDPEALSFAREFHLLFGATGWNVGMRALMGSPFGFGIILPEPAGPSAHSTATIRQAFIAQGIEFNTAPLPPEAPAMIFDIPTQPAARVFIGTKWPWREVLGAEQATANRSSTASSTA
jgi:hypothetical protein